MLAIRKCRVCGDLFDAVVGQDKSLTCPVCRDLAASIITVEGELAACRDFENDFDMEQSREPDDMGGSSAPIPLEDQIEGGSDDNWAPRQQKERLRAAFESLGGIYEETEKETPGSGRAATNKRRESATTRSDAKPAIRGDNPQKPSHTSTDSRAPTWAKKRQADIDAAFSTLRGSETLSLLRDHQRGTLMKSGGMIYAGGKGVLPPDEIDPDVLDFASTIPIPDEEVESHHGSRPFLPQEEINRIFEEVSTDCPEILRTPNLDENNEEEK